MSECERLPGLHRRGRRRGPRSIAALIRRRPVQNVEEPIAEKVATNIGCMPHGWSPCQSGLHCITFLHHNIRGFVSHKDELEILLKLHSYPCFVGLVETFLGPSIHHPKLNGYVVVARRDRGKRRQKGGILFLVREDLLRYVVHLGNSTVAERLWIAFHSE